MLFMFRKRDMSLPVWYNLLNNDKSYASRRQISDHNFFWGMIKKGSKSFEYGSFLDL